ncbi:MAG: HAD family hydrolase [Kiritimatiellia bacterium]
MDIPDSDCYIFDIDGTLTHYVDLAPSTFLHGNFLFPIFRDLLVARGWSRTKAENAIAQVVRDLPFWDYPDFISAFGLPARTAWERMWAWHLEHLAPYEDAVSLARALHDAGKTLIVVSNNPYAGCLMKLKRCGLADELGSSVFRRVFGTDKLRGCKGEPGVWQRALDQIPFDPARICTVGDNPREDGEIPRSHGVGHFLFLDGARR